MLTDTQVEGYFAAARKLVKVTCDDEHAHSAVDGCLDGGSNSPADVVICKLCETIQRERRALRRLVARIGPSCRQQPGDDD